MFISKEIDELKKMLNIEYLPTDYNVKTTSFVRESDDWNNEITIDLGSLAGVSKDMVVISSKGMIGKVTSVTEVTARVQLLTAENPTSALPIQVINGDQNVYGLLNRIMTLSQNVLKLLYLVMLKNLKIMPK